MRATLDSIAYQVADVLAAMNQDSGIHLQSLNVDGGASANNYLMQTQADIIQVPVRRPVCVESTALGAAYLAGLAVSYWKDMDEIRSNAQIERIFEPQITEEEKNERVRGWEKAVRTSLTGLKESDRHESNEFYESKRTVDAVYNESSEASGIFKAASSQIGEGSIIEISVTTAEGKNLCTNMKVRPEDMQLVEELKNLSK